MQRITSFSVDHDYIVPGMYVSRIDGDITTYDLRTRKPNCGDYMDNVTMHSMEHMLATFLRNSDAPEMFGASRKECGNYKELSIEAAHKEAARYLEQLESREQNFKYPTE